MKLDQLVEAAKKLRSSSAWTPGDPTTFMVPLLRREVEMPAACDPYAYLASLKAKLGLPDLAKEHRVGIIGAGLGGLAAAALDLGVAEVVAIEPRPTFRNGLDAIIGLLNQIHVVKDKHKVRAFHGWPTIGHCESLGSFDAIIWPECFEMSVQPIEALTVALALLKPKGRLIIEVRLGQNPLVPAGRVNSWLPTEDAFAKAVLAVNGKAVSASMPGRSVNRIIFAIEAFKPQLPKLPPTPSTLPPFPRDPKAPITGPVVDAPKTGPEPLPVFPRDPALKTVHHIGPVPTPVPAPVSQPAPPIVIAPTTPVPAATTTTTATPESADTPDDLIAVIPDDGKPSNAVARRRGKGK